MIREPGAAGHCSAEKRTALYRFYDIRGELLYIGITSDPWRRWRRHVQEKPWYPRVKHQSVTWYDTEREARKIETRAIRAERPEFNIAGALKPPGRLIGERQALMTIRVLCISIAAACSFACCWVRPLASVVNFEIYSGLLLVLMVMAIRATPWIYGFGCWLNRNFGEGAHLR